MLGPQIIALEAAIIYGNQPKVVVASECHHCQHLCELDGNIGWHIVGSCLGWELDTMLTTLLYKKVSVVKTREIITKWYNSLEWTNLADLLRRAVAEKGLSPLWR
jgi:hypothetical protein